MAKPGGRFSIRARTPWRYSSLPIISSTRRADSSADSASDGRNATYWYGTVFVAVAFFGPIFVLFAANLVASAARRARAEEILAATPTTETTPTGPGRGYWLTLSKPQDPISTWSPIYDRRGRT